MGMLAKLLDRKLEMPGDPPNPIFTGGPWPEIGKVDQLARILCVRNGLDPEMPVHLWGDGMAIIAEQRDSEAVQKERREYVRIRGTMLWRAFRRGAEQMLINEAALNELRGLDGSS